MSGTEDSILNSIPDFAEGGGGEAADSGAAETSSQPTQSGEQGSTSQQPAQQQPVRRRHDGLVEQPNPDNPNARDLVDPITGRTVAKGGIERRVFEEGQRHSRENNALKQQLGAA